MTGQERPSRTRAENKIAGKSTYIPENRLDMMTRRNSWWSGMQVLRCCPKEGQMSVASSRDLASGASLKGSASEVGLLGALAGTRARCYPVGEEQGRRKRKKKRLAAVMRGVEEVRG